MPMKCISKEESEECTACGFMMDAGGCKYQRCQQSSLAECPPCGYMEEVPDSEFGRCMRIF